MGARETSSPRHSNRGTRSKQQQCVAATSNNANERSSSPSSSATSSGHQQDNAVSNTLPLSGVIEYGTVLFYTCSKSCWHGKPVQEMAVVQKEVL